MLIADTTRELIRTEELGKAVHRGARARLLNPKWIEGMLEQGYNGAQHIQERVDNVLGLSATTNEVASWVWDEIEDRYMLDEHVRKQLEKDNPWALRNMMERLLEASRRGYWQASDERIEQLRAIYLELEGLLEEEVKL
jgi:cobaltochelatase CobN